MADREALAELVRAKPVAWMTPGFPQIVSDEWKRENIDVYPWVKEYTLALYVAPPDESRDGSAPPAERAAGPSEIKQQCIEIALAGANGTDPKYADACRTIATLIEANVAAPPPAERAAGPTCQHEWVSARNKIITSGLSICKVCKALALGEPEDQPASPDAPR